MSVTCTDLAAHADAVVRTVETPDYPNAVNGLQLAHRGPVTRIASAVDLSARVIDSTAAIGANFLIVHHGMFWSGLVPHRGHRYDRLRRLLAADIAVYSAHIPLDCHDTMGNSRLLARALNLVPSGSFANFRGVACGVFGDSDIPTEELLRIADTFARGHGGHAAASAVAADRRTRRWAICTGAGVDASTLAEAEALGVDTFITGEAPHWSVVEAPERGLVIICAGHYATETLGVLALGQHLSDTFHVPHEFIAAPTGT